MNNVAQMDGGDAADWDWSWRKLAFACLEHSFIFIQQTNPSTKHVLVEYAYMLTTTYYFRV